MTRSGCLCLLAGLLALGGLAAPAGASSGEVEVYNGFFPYEVHRQTLPNGLDVLVIPMPEFKDVLSYNTLVLAGNREEIEPGKTGLAHLFEHILFRHKWQGEVNGYDTKIGEMGAFNNAYTWFDITYYHPVTFTQNLELLSELESDRFLNLDFTEKIFRTEAGAVMGEYRNGASNPGLRMSEVLAKAMYGDEHGYGHTTIGTLEDVEDMPNEYEAALRFYDDYYRPNNCVLIVSGDVQPDAIFELAARRYGDWEPKERPELPEAPPVGGPKREHVDWPSDVPPRVWLNYQMPAFEVGTKASAVGQLLPELLTSETAPLYQTLRSEKQTVQSLGLGSASYESFDPGRFSLSSTIFKDKYDERGDDLIEEVLKDMMQGVDDLKSFASREDAEATLTALKSKFQYDLLSQIDSPANASENFYWYYRFARDLDVFDALVQSIQDLTPQDIEAVAKQIFVPENQVVVTMSHTPEGAR